MKARRPPKAKRRPRERLSSQSPVTGNIPTGLQTRGERGGVAAAPRSLDPPPAIRALGRALIEYGADLVCRRDDGCRNAIGRLVGKLSGPQAAIENHRTPLRMSLDRMAAGTTSDRRWRATNLIETLSKLPAEQRTMAVLVGVAGLSRERAARLAELDLQADISRRTATKQDVAAAQDHVELPLAS